MVAHRYGSGHLGGLLLALHLETSSMGSPVLLIALLIVGANGIIAVLLRYAAESVPLGVRGRATGWIAACTKAGGLVAQVLSIAGRVPPIGVFAGMIMVPAAFAMLLVMRLGREMRGQDLRDLEISYRRSRRSRDGLSPCHDGSARVSHGKAGVPASEQTCYRVIAARTASG